MPVANEDNLNGAIHTLFRVKRSLETAKAAVQERQFTTEQIKAQLSKARTLLDAFEGGL
jgi:hypothetical protein